VTTAHEDLEYGDDRPSKSARKRAAHAAQDLGEALIGLPEAELSALDIPAELLEAVRAARRITSRAAGARQRQYIGKLMRELDLKPLRAALAARGAVSALEAQRFRRIEQWRERLLGGAALAELLAAHPEEDAALWERRVSAARTERERTPGAHRAGRELFRALRALLDTMP
jgi:ribosome-associated protein